MTLLPGDSAELRKARGAFFTSPAIATYMSAFAINGNPQAKVLDPTCGEAVFLIAAGNELKGLGRTAVDLDEQLYGVDLHDSSLREAMRLLESVDMDGHLVESDFFNVPEPGQSNAPLPLMDAVVGNPPFVRYQEHVGTVRKASLAAALRQGVRLNGLASSWAAALVHASSFLKPDGRLAMVLPAELLTVGYAEPIRTWLRRRFAKVHLVMFEDLQFDDALEKVVLLLAEGTGGCDSLKLDHLQSAADLGKSETSTHWTVTPPNEGKWSELFLAGSRLSLFKKIEREDFVPLSAYGTSVLGTVTGANKYFTFSEATRLKYGLREDQLLRISPPGTKHLKGLTFTARNWQALREAGEPVWMLSPNRNDDSEEVEAYKQLGYDLKVDEAYKCKVRRDWWIPSAVAAPDLFFTYMSHRYPRLIANNAKASFVNSMHGVKLHKGVPGEARFALPLLCLNSVTMIGAELHGRSYGGGILKMEPREAARLPLPSPAVMQIAWRDLKPLKDQLDRKLRNGHWSEVVKRVDAAVLGAGCNLRDDDVSTLLETSRSLRTRRLGRDEKV